jgi:hypothetical protein
LGNLKLLIDLPLIGTSVFFSFFVSAQSSDATSSLQSANALSSHWVPGWGYRDELNTSDTDNQNFWADNAGKILTMAELTNDTQDASQALSFFEHNGLGTSNYLPEAVVNSSMLELNNGSGLTNRIAMLQASNGSSASSDLEQLAIGDYYAGEQVLSYLGSDRILVNGTIYRSTNATTFETSDGFVKRSEFATSQGVFYVYLNATISEGNAYAQVSMQVLPISTSLNSSDLLYLQVFSSEGQFDNASLYDLGGNYQRNLVYNNGSPSAQNGTIIAYSKQENVFTQDSVAINFGSSASSSGIVNDFEHWYHNAAFDSLSWIGIAYNAPQNAVGKLSAPIFANVYPVQHMDYRLVNDTAKYIALDMKNTTVSPPVGFGFIAYGLALDSSKNSGNETLATLADNYWNYYYSRYEPFHTAIDYSTAYARSINTFALAGFTLYGCNSTVENFARNYIGNTSGSSIEEYGWGVAALYKLETCTRSAGDISLYDSFVNSFGTSKSNFIVMSAENIPNRSDLNPSFTFQFGEAASGLLLGGIPYNDPVVLEAMDAVYQSNVSGTLLNQPFHGDLANTETIPAYLLSTSLFQSEMRSGTNGYWISGIKNANLTSIDYYNGTLLISAYGNNGTIVVSSSGKPNLVFSNISGFATEHVTAATTTTTSSSCSPANSPSCLGINWLVLIVSAVFFIIGALLFVMVAKAKRART